MSNIGIDNVNVIKTEVLITPEQLISEMPLTDKAAATVLKGRKTIENILDKKDHRLFVVIGPCSIHDVDAAKDYAKKLKALAAEVEDTLYLVMRVYFEKPRTTVGWKGLINDPHLNDSFDVQQGLHIGRSCYWILPSLASQLPLRHWIRFLHSICKIPLPGRQSGRVPQNRKPIAK